MVKFTKKNNLFFIFGITIVIAQQYERRIESIHLNIIECIYFFEAIIFISQFKQLLVVQTPPNTSELSAIRAHKLLVVHHQVKSAVVLRNKINRPQYPNPNVIKLEASDKCSLFHNVLFLYNHSINSTKFS